MGQALNRARGAVARYGQATKAQESLPRGRSSRVLDEEDAPIVLVKGTVRKVKTPEQIEAEARWAAKAKILYGQPKPAPDSKARLRAQETKVTDYRPEPPYDQPRNPFDQPASEESFGEAREWNKTDPNYRFMVQKAAGKVATRSQNLGAEAEKVAASAQMFAHKPLSRAKVNQEDIDGRIVPGKLNIVQLKQAYLLYQGRAEGEVKRMDVEAIAQKFEVKADQLKKLFQYTGLAEGRPSDFNR